MNHDQRRHPAGLTLLVALMAAPLLLRAPISSVPPVLDQIADTLRFGPAIAGLATALPVLCFGLFAFVTPLLYRRIGLERTLSVALALIAVGIVVRYVVTTPTFFAGTLIIGLAIAIGNVVLPAIVRAHFPLRVPGLMAVYSLNLQLSAAGGAFLTTPLIAAGFSWPGALAVWVVPALIALLAWVLASRPVSGPQLAAAGPQQASVRSVLGLATTWVVLAYMGFQSMLFYGQLTWIPRILADHGMGAAHIGFWFGLFNLLGLPGSFLGPVMVGRRWTILAVWAVIIVYMLGVVALMASATTAILGVVLCGLVQGAQLSLGLTLIARQGNPEHVAPVSAIAQGGGYALSALSPWLMGVLYAASGNWTGPMVMQLIVSAACGVAGAWAASRK